MASGSFYEYPVSNFGLYCTWESQTDEAHNQSVVTLKTYLSYYTLNAVSQSQCTTSIDGSSETFTAPAISVSSASSWTKKLINTRTETIKHSSDGTKKITLSASYPFNGTYSETSIGIITASKTVTLDNIITDCTTPTSFTVTSDNVDDDGYNEAFETKLTLKWSEAKAGIGNAITGYQILYATNSDNSTWSYSNLQKITSTSTSGSVTIDMSSKVSRGNYVRFRIQVLGSAGSSYYSGVKTASYTNSSGVTSYSVKRNPYTACTAPTTVTASSNNFDSTVTVSWSGAKAGVSNNISSYYIQYATSSNNSTWGSWTGLMTVNSTNTSGSKSIDMSSKVSRGNYVKFRIRTQGSAGSSYYSGYTSSSSIRRQSYTKCNTPTSFSVADSNPNSTSIFRVVLSWSGASGGTDNSISSYYIQYATSSNNSSWSSWSDLISVTSTKTSGSYDKDIASKVTRGYYVKFRIQVRGSAGSSYYSSYKETDSIRRNPYTGCTAPTTVTIASDKSGQPFETNITIKWSGASSGTNHSIQSYIIKYSTSADKSTGWSDYKDLTEVISNATSGSKSIDMSSKVSRGDYVKIAIKTVSAINSNYDSSYQYSASLQRNPYSVCGEPTTVIIKSEVDMKNVQHTDVFNNEITISWSGATAGSNNAIKRYYIEYCTSTNKSTWSSWASLQSSNLTPVGTSTTTVDISAKVDRGDYTKFRIRTEGEAGSSYYSPYVETSPIRRNSLPTVSTLTVFEPTTLEYSYGDSIVLKWNEATDSNVNTYEISVRYTENDDWLAWQVLNSNLSNTTTSYTLSQSNNIYQSILNNQQVQFRIRVQDVFGEYSTTYSNSTMITRYDDMGICIGVNGKWIKCQIYVGTNDKWVEQSIGAGVNNTWLQCGLE